MNYLSNDSVQNKQNTVGIADRWLWLSLASFLLWLFCSYEVRAFLSEVSRLLEKLVAAAGI